MLLETDGPPLPVEIAAPDAEGEAEVVTVCAK
jgi:hypothetical protein